MVVGFLKGIWGKPAQQGSGLMGIWGTITKVPTTIYKGIMLPGKIIGTLILLFIGYFLYKRFK